MPLYGQGDFYQCVVGKYPLLKADFALPRFDFCKFQAGFHLADAPLINTELSRDVVLGYILCEHLLEKFATFVFPIKWR